ncbi:uncharacterized protein LOC142229392 [Haematobia irritans]|uniref:uncharacterized protein LOC142229392 n=1 Tax=Haematobia irritans TaxID=7368 RepID=UPI003F4F5F87
MATLNTIEWSKHHNLPIHDIHEKQHGNVIEYVLQHYFDNELFKILGYHEDREFHIDLVNILKHCLKNDCSIMVSDPEYNEIYGVAILKCMTEEWYSWISLRLLINGNRFKELMDFTYIALQDYAREKHEKSDGLHLFYYYVEPWLESQECFMIRFFNAISLVASYMHMPRITYMALSHKEAIVLEEDGYNEIVRILYSMYVYKGRRPFDHLRDLNEMHGSLYEIKVEPIMHFEEIAVRNENPEENVKQVTGK